MTPAKIAFYIVMSGLLGLGAYKGVLLSRAGVVHRRDDPKFFYGALAFYAVVIATLPWIV